MSRYPRDELTALERRSDAAWLWDADRTRIVWANRAGLAFWSETNVLDLIERRMDGADAAIARMGGLAAALEPGASVVEPLVFDIGGQAEAMQAEYRRVLLEDGRPGLLVIGLADQAVGPASVATRASLLEAVVANLPNPVAVFDRHGSLLFQNEAANESFPSSAEVLEPGAPADREPETGSAADGGLFAFWLRAPSRAEALMSRALTRGGFSEVGVLHTRFGPRAHRINARRLTVPVVGKLAILLTFDDIEDRHRHEKRQNQSLAAVEALLEAVDATFEIDAQGCLVEFGGAAEDVLGDGIGVLVGTAWDDVLAALDFEFAIPFAKRSLDAKPWREILWPSSGGAPVLAISAVPLHDKGGVFSGFRGLALAMDPPLLRSSHGRRSEERTDSETVIDEPKPQFSDEEEFLADLQADHEAGPVAEDPEISHVDRPTTDTPDRRPVGIETRAGKNQGRKGKAGRDDAATFSAIARALGTTRKSSEPAPIDTSAGGATLRVVGGVEAIETQGMPPAAPAPVQGAFKQAATKKGETAQQLLAAGQPALIHRQFDILDANEELAGLLGFSTVEQLLRDPNLLNLMPDERAGLFSLQSRFDDSDLPKTGRIEGIALKLRKKDRTIVNAQASFDEVELGGHPAVRIIFGITAEVEKPKSDAGAGENQATAALQPPTRTASGGGPGLESSAGVSLELIEPASPSPKGRVSPKLEQLSELSADSQSDGAALSASVAREAELRAVINTAADGIATLDGDGRIITLNASAEAIFGVMAPAMVGRPFSGMFVADDTNTIDAYLTSVTSNESSRLTREGHEVRGMRDGGAEIPLFVTIGRMNVEEEMRFCAVVRDISQWKETEDSLRHAKERAEEDSAKKSDFLARISHELRTPLNAIIGFSEVMSEEKFGPIANDRYKGYLHDIRSSGGHLLSLINDLLDLSKIEAGKLELNFTSVDIARTIEQGVVIIQPQANQARVIVRVSLPEYLPPVVADERSLRQIVLNLLSNAVKFTPPGGQVILSAVVDDLGQLQIRVRDTGVGMSSNEIDRAMEPFRQIDDQGQSGHSGTGLGLPLTKALTEANRAEFQIESTPSAGTLVNITFPTNRVLDG